MRMSPRVKTAQNKLIVARVFVHHLLLETEAQGHQVLIVKMWEVKLAKILK